MVIDQRKGDLFESSVNSEGIETFLSWCWSFSGFESSVNSEGIETGHFWQRLPACLRAV